MSIDRLNTKEAGEFIHRSAWAVRQYAAAGELPFYRLPGGQLLFERSDLEAWLKKPRPKPERAKANSMGVYKRKDYPYWYLQYFAAGERIQENSGKESKQEALQVLARRKEELTKGTWRHPRNRRATFGELIDKYKASPTFSALAAKTQRFYRQRLVILAARFGDNQALDLTREDVEEFIEDRRAEVSDTTAGHEVTTLLVVLHWAVRKNLISHMPFLSEKLKPAPAQYLSRVLRVEEEKAIHAAAEHYQRAMILAALDAGLRKGEIYAQRWEHIDLAGNLLMVTKSKGRTGGGGRQIPLTGRLHALLLSLPRESEYVFTYKGQRILTDTKKSWYRILEDAKVPAIRFHDLRATFSTRLEELGVPPMISMALMGHKRKSVHDRYSRPQLPALREAIGKLDGWLRESGLVLLDTTPLRAVK